MNALRITLIALLMAACLSRAEDALKAPIDVNFQRVKLKDVLASLADKNKLKVSLDPKVDAKAAEAVEITITATKMRAENALKLIAKSAKLDVDVRSGDLFFKPAEGKADATLSADQKADNAEVEKLLARKITFEFTYTPMSEALAYIQDLSKLNMVIDPGVYAAKKHDVFLNVHANNLELKTALKGTCAKGELEFTVGEQAVYIYFVPGKKKEAKK